VLGAPAIKFASLAASLQEGEEGNQRGGGGLLIGTGAGLNYSGNKGIEGRGNSGRRFPVEEVMREEEDADRWAPPVSGEKEKEKKREENGSGGKWAAGLGTAQVGCCLPFPIFFDLKPFSFSVFFKSS
jgi:hypothetical protein